MDCPEIKEILMTDYVDGECTRQSLEIIKEHLASCPACKQFEESLLRNAVNPLRGSAMIRPPAWLWTRISQGIREKEKKRRSWIPFFVPAAVLAGIVAGFIWFGPGPRIDEPGSSVVSDQMDFLSELELSNGNGETYEVDFGTGIEEYFL